MRHFKVHVPITLVDGEELLDLHLQRPRPAVSGPPGNTTAVTHGASAESQIRPAARSQKRRLLRQIGLAASDPMESAGRCSDNWARAQAKVELCDRYFAERGFLDADGEPVAGTKVYFVAVNSARLALVRLREHLEARHASPLPALGDEGSAQR